MVELRAALEFLVFAGLAFLAARVLTKPACALLTRGGLSGENFKGDVIPTGVGIVVPLASFIPIALLGSPARATLWLLVLFGVGMLGLIDDAAGSGEHGGFTRHMRALWRGDLTTGAVKALFGGGIALYAGWALHPNSVPALMAAGVIALSTNAVNLLDLRPGRAIKGALALFACGLAGLALGSPFDWALEHAKFACAPLGAGIALLRGDLKARYMIGDIGANVLGVSAGMLLASLPHFAQAIALSALILLHLVSERRSLSAVIASVPALKWLDEIGRE